MFNNCVSILSIDGGGVRGIIPAQFMVKFQEQAKLANIYSNFDIICGTSIGGISSLAYSKGMTPKELLNLLITKAPIIFNGYFGKGPAGSAALGAVLAGPGYNPVLYPNQPLQDVLNEVLGNTRMFQLKTNVLLTSLAYLGGTPGADDTSPVIPPATGNYTNTYFPYKYENGDKIYKIEATKPINFSNVRTTFTTGRGLLAKDVGLATSAAPVFFPPIQLSNSNNPTKDPWYLDGGLSQNNPLGLGYTLAKILYPTATQYCILSLGTGKAIGRNIPTYPNLKVAPQNGLGLLSECLNMTIEAAQDAVDQQFQALSLYSGGREQIYYYRFQPFIPSNISPQLDNVQDGFADQLINVANKQYDLDQLKISIFIQNFKRMLSI